MTEPKQSYFKEALSLMGATIPLLMTRLAVYTGFFLIAMMWLGFWGGLGLFLGAVLNSGMGVLICFIIALGFGWPAWRMARKYVLYMVRAPHVAAMTEVMLGRDVPKGAGQFKYGKEIVENYFKDASVLWIVHEAVDAAVRGLSRTLSRLTNWLPDSLKSLRNILLAIVRRAASYIDEAIFSHAIAERHSNAYEGATEGLILYAQNSKPILITAAKTYLLGKILSFTLFAIFVIPALVISVFIASAIEGAPGELLVLFGVVIAFLGARFVELAIFEPFALAYTMVTFRRETAGQQADPQWEAKLRPLHKKVGRLFDLRDQQNKQPVPSLAPGDSVPHQVPPQ